MSVTSKQLYEIADMSPKSPIGVAIKLLADGLAKDEHRKHSQRERTRKCRLENVTVTLPSRYSDVTVTLPEKCAYISSTNPILLELEKVSKDHKTRGTRLPESWQPSTEDAQYANAAGFCDLEIAAMREEFVDYWISIAGSKARKASWPATWRRWIRTATERRKPAAPKKRTTYDLADELRAAANAASGQDQPDDGGALAVGFSEIIPPNHGWKPEPRAHEGDGVDFHPVSGKDPPRDLLAADRDGYQF